VHAQFTDEKLILTKVTGFRPFSYSSITTKATKETGFKGLPAGLKDYMIREAKILPSLAEERYQKYVKGEMNAEAFVALYPNAKRIKKTLEKRKIILLVAENMDGQKIIVVDTNYDKDFGNDQVFKYPGTPDLTRKGDGDFVRDEKFKNLLDVLPSVRVPTQNFDGEKLVDRDLAVKCVPYRSGDGSKDKRDEDLYAEIFLFEYRTGGLMTEEKKYKIATDPTMGPTPAFRPDLHAIEFLICEDSGDGLWKNPVKGPHRRPFVLGDSLSIDGSQFILKSISAFGDTLTISRKQSVN
jgi:hypothetical protein